MFALDYTITVHITASTKVVTGRRVRFLHCVHRDIPGLVNYQSWSRRGSTLRLTEKFRLKKGEAFQSTTDPIGCFRRLRLTKLRE